MKKLKSILIIEDEEDITEILKIAIEHSSDILLSFATNGQDGLTKANIEKPDLILLDVLMPGMSGLELMDELNKNEILKQIPVIFITSRVQRSEIQEYKKRGAIGLIEKPFAPLEIVTRIHLLLEENEQLKKLNP
ncbi:response regulator [Leptospira ognonensis]|uniref:Response regulator n=1 Tax=Leptospira ognonensis TaxID=2484945 RepID=A0A4R9K0E2_9LEPT|nr:response regulator [Leptospira ognonensis]TGL59113.1 response regulator [Leptospira ognonensis]